MVGCLLRELSTYSIFGIVSQDKRWGRGHEIAVSCLERKLFGMLLQANLP